jgi:acyl-coenzyme A thioesterase PaaI-like protein
MEIRERIKLLKEDFDRQPCAQAHSMELDVSNDGCFIWVAMKIARRHCVIDSDGRFVVQGGIIATVVDFAGVYGARLLSETPHQITPLKKLDEWYTRPFVFGEDREIVARAVLVFPKIDTNGIFIPVVVDNESGDCKGRAELLFAKRFSKSP